MTTLVSHVWKPSKSRTITIDSFVPVPRGTVAVTPALLSWPSKDPADVLDYQVSIQPALTGNEGDCIESADIDIHPNQPGDLSVDNVSADGATIIIWMSGGQSGVVYTVTIKTALASGRTLQRSIFLPVVALSSPSTPVNAIQTNLAGSLTDQNGNPIVSA